MKQVQEHLNLTEWEYFGLFHESPSRSGWLESNKLIKKQLDRGYFSYDAVVVFYSSAFSILFFMFAGIETE